MDKRADFVNNELSTCIAAAYSYIARVEWVDSDTVDIVCNNGYRYHVCITADSESGILADVVNEARCH